MKIDVHSHIEITDSLNLSPGRHAPASVAASLRDTAKKIADLDRMGLDRALLSVVPSQFSYELEGRPGLKVSRLQNDRMAALVQNNPTRFAGMATVPLQDVEVAVSELERAVSELNLKGVEIGSNVRGKYLGGKGFWPFYEKVVSLDVPILIHPVNPPGTDRLKEYYLTNILGLPLDTTVTAAHLIFSGTLDRFPDLKIVLTHAGGYLPYIIGRMEHGFNVRSECRENIKNSPVEYLKLFYYDTISHHTKALQFLMGVVGADHVLLGTDHPYDMCDSKPLQSVDAMTQLSPEDREKIVGKNALALLKMF